MGRDINPAGQSGSPIDESDAMKKGDKGGKSQAVAGFGDRISAAAAAKKALVESFRANKIDVNDPAYLEQQAIRAAAAAAKAEREAGRKAEKDAA